MVLQSLADFKPKVGQVLLCNVFHLVWLSLKWFKPMVWHGLLWCVFGLVWHCSPQSLWFSSLPHGLIMKIGIRCSPEYMGGRWEGGGGRGKGEGEGEGERGEGGEGEGGEYVILRSVFVSGNATPSKLEI
jgi:hypothetical protein